MKNFKNFVIFACGLAGIFIFHISAVFATGTTPAISSASFRTGNDKIFVTFNMPVYGNANGTGALDCSDFVVASGNGAVGIQNLTGASCTHVAGNNWAVIEVSDAQAADTTDNADTIRAAANSIFTVGGAVSEAAVNLVQDLIAPTFSVKYKSGDDKLMIIFSEPVFTTNYNSPANPFNNAAISNSSFTFTDGNTAGASAFGELAIHSADRTTVILDLDANLIAGDIDGSVTADKINSRAAGDTASVYDIHGNVVASAAKTLGSTDTSSDSAAPTITSAEAVKDGQRILVTFSESVFTDSTLAPLSNLAITTDLKYFDTDKELRTLNPTPAVNYAAGDTWILLTLSEPIATADLNSDTIAAASTNAIVDAFGNNMGVTTMLLNDTTSPIILNVMLGTSNNKNTVMFYFSEDIKMTNGEFTPSFPTASSNSFGDLTSAGTLTGLGSFAVPGNITCLAQKNSVLLDSTGTVLTIILAGQNFGVKTSTGITEPSGTFTPASGCASCIADLSPTGSNGIAAFSVVKNVTGNGSWNIIPPSATSGLSTRDLTASQVELIWTPASGVSDFGRYAVYYKETEAGIAIANGTTAWTHADDNKLSSLGTNITTVTGLRTGVTYYFAVTTIDLAGNSAFSNEIQVVLDATRHMDATPPDLPTNIQVSANNPGKVTLIWTDPTASDLKHIEIFRIKDGGSSVGSLYTTVLKTWKIYTDTDTVLSDKINYTLRAVDTSGNVSPFSETITVNVIAASSSNTQNQTGQQEQTQQNQNPTQQIQTSTSDKAKIQKKIDALNAAISKYNLTITKYNVKIAKLNKKKKNDRLKITKYKKAISNIRKTIKKKGAQVKKMQKKLAE